MLVKYLKKMKIYKTFPSNNDRFAGWAQKVCELKKLTYKNSI